VRSLKSKPSSKAEISAVVITRNEERNIGRCLESVLPIAREIVVVDSGSTDRTREIASRYTERVLTRGWLGFGAQKQFAADQARCPWVLSIDADEEVSPELGEEIAQLDLARDGYFLNRQVWYLDRWILHGAWYPDPVLRLFRRDRARFTPDPIHERVQLSGSAGHLRGALYHYSYRDLAHHLAKMNERTSLAADWMYQRGRHASWARLAVEPGWKFFRSYVLQSGYRDGVSGLVASAIHAQYTLLKYAKLRELTIRSEGSSPPSTGE